jgi:hypothetical protein
MESIFKLMDEQIEELNKTLDKLTKKTQENIMETEFKMKEATNRPEAIASIVDVLSNRPLWTNKCKSDLFAVVDTLSVPAAESLLMSLRFEQVKNLFIEIKKEYYNSIDWSTKF